MAGLVPTCYVSQVGTRPPAILDETLSEQRDQIFEGKQRTFGFRCSAEAECFSEFALQISGITCSDNVSPINSFAGRQNNRPPSRLCHEKQNGRWSCAYLLCFTSRHKTTCHFGRNIVRTKLYQIQRVPEKHSASGVPLKPNVSLSLPSRYLV